jgi:hypothetical protein
VNCETVTAQATHMLERWMQQAVEPFWYDWDAGSGPEYFRRGVQSNFSRGAGRERWDDNIRAANG